MKNEDNRERASHLAWFLGEIPRLVAEGAIDDGVAERLKADTEKRLAEAKARAHAAGARNGKASPALAVFATIGATLIGLGLVLVFAFNWSGIARPVKIAIAFIPLASSVALVILAITRKTASTAWRESTAILNLLCLTLALALFGQIYHLPGTVTSFLFPCILLAIPLLYATDSLAVFLTVTLALSACFIMARVEGLWESTATPAFGASFGKGGLELNPIFRFSLLSLASLPWLGIRLFRERKTVRASGRYGAATNSALWVFAIALTMNAAPLCLDVIEPASSVFIILYPCLYGCLFLAGSIWMEARDKDSPGVMKHPLRSLGFAGTILSAFILSYGKVWELIEKNNTGSSGELVRFIIFRAPFIGFLIVALASLSIIALTRRLWFRALFAGFPVACTLAVILSAGDPGNAIRFMPVFADLFLLGTGIVLVIGGDRQRRMAPVNGGAFIISLLIFLRFVISDSLPGGLFSRGIVFILVGSGFLAMNLFLSKRYKEKTPKGGDAPEEKILP